MHKYAIKLNQALINQILTKPIETKRIEKIVGKERGYQGDGLTLSCIYVSKVDMVVHKETCTPKRLIKMNKT